MTTLQELEALEIAMIEIGFQMNNAKEAMKVIIEEMDFTVMDSIAVEQKKSEVLESLDLVKRLIENLEV